VTAVIDSSTRSVESCLRAAASGLRQARGAADGPDAAEARAEAEVLLAHALGKPRSWLYAWGDASVPAPAAQAFDRLVMRRAAGEPVAYLTGRRGFWTLELEVGPDTLIPRPETERLVELALERLPAGRPLTVADLGTGSGAIALAIASERPQARVHATDASPGALAVAQANAARLGLGNVRCHAGAWDDWYGALAAALAGARCDLIASNPPYIAEGDAHLSRGDLRFEPATALSSGADGLDAIRAIVAGAPVHLHPGGWLLLEHGLDQGAAIRALLAEAGFAEIATHADLEDRERVTLGRCADAGGRAG